ncbi:MAG: hypothetical protein IK121_02955 [Lachnospiraceae bacterium]|nr:hypothetical protein [Lachnospiraceae bacterium]
MEIMYINVKGGKPYINNKGEVVVTMNHDDGNKPEVNYRIVHSYTSKGSEEKKWRISDKGALKTNKLQELHITRKGEDKK